MIDTRPKFESVISGERRWSIERADALEFLGSLPDDSVDLLITSPPYEDARTYGLGRRLPSGEAWVSWMFDLVKAAAPKVRGLIAINCEGKTRGFSYSAVPFLLLADLKRAGFVVRKPPIFRRVGIPGSGGPDWLRNDYEPIICVTRPGKLPFADNTACGHTPKWAPGGEMAHRLSDGTRVNQWGKCGTEAGANGIAQRTRDGGRQPAKRPSHRMHTKRDPDGSMREQAYSAPVLANPGNVIECKVGGGHMGHELASENEAPFPLELPTLFVRSFCPPNGIVCDPFSGSGTTAHACLDHGRRFIGCDIRESQILLCERRLSTVTPTLFAGL